MRKDLVATSKFLSLVLRHRPETIGMQLDPEGWPEITALLENVNKHGHAITREVLLEVVATNDKQRFALSEDGLRIRANQGHSLRDVDLELTPVTPPDQLFHGTVARFLSSIRAQGLLKGQRNHVHLSADRATASRVGMRRGKPVVLTIASGRMHDAGQPFFLSANGVWLTDHVPVEYIEFP